MAKKNRSAKAKRTARQARREEKAAMRGGLPAPRGRNIIVLGMILTRKGGSHGDEKKKAARRACRGKVHDD
jgi:hypothetical protein